MTSLTGAPEVVGQDGHSLRRWWDGHRRLRRFLTRVGVVLSLSWLLLVIVAAIFAPLVAPHDPISQDLLHPNAGVSASHWFGTDDLGRDVLSRLIYGARISMQVPFETVAIALIVALVIGLLAGYRGGAVRGLVIHHDHLADPWVGAGCDHAGADPRSLVPGRDDGRHRGPGRQRHPGPQRRPHLAAAGQPGRHHGRGGRLPSA